MNKKILLSVVGGISIIGASYFVINNNYDPYEVPEDVNINLNENIFKVYEEHNSSELIKDINAEIISEEKILENEKIGNYTYTLLYKYKKRKYKYDINYQIKDMTPPVFINAPSNLTMEASDELEVCEKIVYADDYQDIPNCQINGTYDKKSIGYCR